MPSDPAATVLSVDDAVASLTLPDALPRPCRQARAATWGGIPVLLISALDHIARPGVPDAQPDANQARDRPAA
jgi:hypothetical protein